MKKKLIILAGLVLVSVCALAQPKYVFYFIGDGMGVNQVQMTEMFLASAKGELGIEKLAFTQFPVATMSTHFSASSNTTDSAASGTALATGTKTNNGCIGVGPDGEILKNIAEIARDNGKKVGVVTTVEINHATPAAFSAHQANRGMGYEIAQDMIANGFDFYGGAGIINSKMKFNGEKAEPIKPQFEAAGYTICNVEGFKAGYKDMKKVLMLPVKGQHVEYAIDAKNIAPEKCITLTEFVESAITFLMKDNKKGFFLMAEGGEIDHACHSHDAKTTIDEVIDFDNAIKVALEFYKKYPKQTLIVVSADHETGGLVINPKAPADLARLSLQKHSMNVLSDMLKDKMVESKAVLTWDQVKDFLKAELGFFGEIKISWDEEKELRDIYESTIAKRNAGSVKDLYADNSAIISTAIRIFNEKSRVHWTGSHSAGYTPVYAIGVGSDLFTHKTDNAELPMTIKKAAAYK